MSSYAGKNYTTPRSNYVASGLEDDLHRLALGDPSGAPIEFSQQSPVPRPVGAAAGGPVRLPPPGFGPGPVQPAAIQNEARNLEQKPPGRKRPNQAQRRQMSSQLSIPVDTRPAPQSPKWRGHDQRSNQGGQHAPFPRHQHTMSHPHSNPGHFRSHQQDHSPWNDGLAAPHGGSNLLHGPSGYVNHQPQPHRNGQNENRPRHNSGMHGHRYGRSPFSQEEILSQSTLLEKLCFKTLASSEIDRSEIAEKEAFRQRIESICRQVITEHERSTHANPDFPPLSVQLKCFGSLSSGFATKASDMDLGLLSPLSHIEPDAAGSPIPRLIEKAFLDAGIGARLLSRTRVPIIKLCESPPERLLKDLLTQREKWEAGLDQDHNESHDEDEQALGQNLEAKDEESTEQGQDVDSIDLSRFQIPDESGQLHEFHIRQTSKHNLAGYHGLAKRVLRKAGGRDVTLSNLRDFTPYDWMVLNQVCRAFVHGLADATLRHNLTKYPSLAFETATGLSHNRSLLGVSVQVEGEQVIQLWHNWPLSYTLAALDPISEQYIGLWHELQCRQNFGEDPISYAKELQLALERLKKLPSFQLLLFEQSQQESVTQYYERMLTIIKHLKISRLDNTDEFKREAVHKYTSGILHEDVRNDVRSWQSSSGAWDLDVIACKHRCLQLAADLERALNKKLYEGAASADVSRCIDLLRGPLVEAVGPSGSRALVISLGDDETNQLFSRIRFIPDPHTIAPNQPRDRYRDPLEFPKHGAGVQCDINFSAHLALENTTLLRCYAYTDPRVRPMVLFVKHWAKVRGINSGYRGTLSSYGYVLMVLHYLVNVASPFVCPNLQQVGLPDQPAVCKGYNVSFWRDEAAITQLAHSNQINQNGQAIGYLLRGFFEYYAQNGALSTVPGRGFDWGRDVLSLRSRGGLLTKQDKGWTGAKTVYQAQDPNESSVRPPANAADGTPEQVGTVPKTTAVKEIRLRYLFAIEDPFEVEHNVARTVTHNGIVSIRDEFRRAWRIIQAAGQGLPHDDLLEDANQEGVQFLRSLYEIHGWTMTDDYGR
ncbi:hypothetical protein V2A60_003670 [Cordyceps javanica]